MSRKNLFILILITIITLGIFWIFYYLKKRKIREKPSLSRVEKLPFPLEKLFLNLGKNNFIYSEYTHTRVKIFINNYKNIKINEILKLKSISGTFLNSKSLTIIVGNSAKKISEELNNYKNSI